MADWDNAFVTDSRIDLLPVGHAERPPAGLFFWRRSGVCHLLNLHNNELHATCNRSVIACEKILWFKWISGCILVDSAFLQCWLQFAWSNSKGFRFPVFGGQLRIAIDYFSGDLSCSKRNG
jgi:hypothetical protein